MASPKNQSWRNCNPDMLQSQLDRHASQHFVQVSFVHGRPRHWDAYSTDVELNKPCLFKRAIINSGWLHDENEPLFNVEQPDRPTIKIGTLLLYIIEPSLQIQLCRWLLCSDCEPNHFPFSRRPLRDIISSLRPSWVHREDTHCSRVFVDQHLSRQMPQGNVASNSVPTSTTMHRLICAFLE